MGQWGQVAKQGSMAGALTLLLITSVASVAASEAAASDLDHAPPAFNANGLRAVPIDIRRIDLDLELDAAAGTSRGVATLSFSTREAGNPMIRFAREASAAALDGARLDKGLVAAQTPQSSVPVRIVPVAVKAGEEHQLRIEYSLGDQVTFQNGGAAVGFFMSDLEPVGFLEQYVPSNFEYDAFPMGVRVKVVGGQAQHRLFANGAVRAGAGQEWTVEYPAYFTPSSYYFHLTNSPVSVSQGEYAGLEKKIPITAYAEDSRMADEAIQTAKSTLQELEGTYGPFAHASLTIYITPDGGGMEYCGATMTSLWALTHEITHSWFARGVMPANGDAGWMDEATASWRDNQYPTRTSPPAMAARLSGFSPYNIATPMASYYEGADLLAHFDSLLPGGLKPALRDWFGERKRTAVTTQEFEAFLTARAGQAGIPALFRKYVYAMSTEADDGGQPRTARPESWLRRRRPVDLSPGHPRKYTREELERYR